MTKRREFLLLADTFKADKHDPVGMIASEKLDGMRVFWDGGVSRGDDTGNVPWASVHNPKTGELKDKIKAKSTGLWSRYGSPINAPDWFIDQLPPEPLDGELYIGRGEFQRTVSTVRKDVPVDSEWKRVSFVAFGAPTFSSVFQSGLIKNANMHEVIDIDECRDYITGRGFGFHVDERTYLEELVVLEELGSKYGGVFETTHCEYIETMEGLNAWLKVVTDLGGEGLMLRDPESTWFPKRRPFLLKVKPRHDAEATIVGFVAGKKGKTGQFLGKLGTLVCHWYGDETAPCGLLKAPVEFEIGTGLTHRDRAVHPDDVEYLETIPGKRVDGCITLNFSVGDRITFSYMGVTNDNVPREPAYLRKRCDT